VYVSILDGECYLYESNKTKPGSLKGIKYNAWAYTLDYYYCVITQ